MRFLRSARVRASALAVALLAVPVTGALMGSGFPGAHVTLSGGAAWLASPQQGLVTLIDGASEQVIGSVRAPAAKAGDDLTVVQAGSAALVLNAAQGTVARVDSGTYEVSDAVKFGEQDGRALSVFVGGDSAYVVDGQRRVASVTDPVSLKVRQRLSLAAQPGAEQSVVDKAGRLWLIDPATGSLTWFDDGKQVKPGGADAASRLVLVQGRPVLVDAAHSRIGALDDDGGVEHWNCLDVRSGDRAQLLGSSTGNHVFAAVSASGTLLISAVGHDDCGRSVDVGAPGDTFGPLVESGGFVFVPNRTSGHTVVVDVAAARVAADLKVVDPGRRLELLAKDGFVFYNDLDGDRAGVIRLDGEQWRLGKALKKFGAGDPQLLTGDGDAGQTSNPNPGGTTTPGTTPTTTSTGTQQPKPPTTTPPKKTPGPTKTTAGPAPQPVIRDITWEPAQVVRTRTATWTAAVDNAAGATWAWEILDQGGTVLHQASSAGTMTHTLPAGTPDNLQVKLTVRTSAGQAVATRPFSTVAVGQLTVDLRCSVTAPSLNQPVSCSGTVGNAGSGATWTWTVTGPGQSGAPEQGTPGTARSERFTAGGAYAVKLAVAYDGRTVEDTVNLNVSDHCQIGSVSPNPADVRRNIGVNGVEQPIVNLTGCFVHTIEPTVTVPSWLKTFAPTMSWDGADSGTGRYSFAMSKPTASTRAPADGLNNDVVTIALPNGQSVAYDVLANNPPTIEDTYACDKQADGRYRFVLKYADADPSTTTATIRVGSYSGSMTKFSHGGAPVFFEAVLTAAQVGSFTTWTGTVSDKYKETASGGDNRGNCT
ncbi:hypothetical protein AB0K00_09275 [Dactylosporangium sp. NPDC049525]|uniref:hypothetical protein n=1 Tax=Dactylosporangium sp. NPDC049525 TaxID=3154730 RepID=UPI00342A098B